MTTLGPAMECPNCHLTVFLSSTNALLEQCHGGPWKVTLDGSLRRRGWGKGDLAIHHCKELR